MLVLDLFCGLQGWAETFRKRGHQVFTRDLDPRFQADCQKDILQVTAADLPAHPDVILASPPCEGFSVMQIGRNWNHDHSPKTEKARLAEAIVVATLELIKALKPRFFVIENPRAKLRKLPLMAGLERRTVTYCNYGEKRMKPTDLWGVFPPSLELAPPCNNGDPCHVSAPRGSRTGSQGMESALSARIPDSLSLAVCLACERDLSIAALPPLPDDVTGEDAADFIAWNASFGVGPEGRPLSPQTLLPFVHIPNATQLETRN